MMQKNSVRFGKLLLLFGLGLTALVVLETHQEIGGALDLSHVPGNGLSDLVREAAPDAAADPPLDAEVRTDAEAKPDADAASSESERETLAIDADVEAVNPQEVAQIDPSEMAVNQWQGASFPLEGFQEYTSPFGYRSSPMGGYSQEFHYGLDMAAPSGSYIRNWWSGTVVEVTDDSNCGTSVVVESGSWLHIYCHMQGHVESNSQGRYMIDREGGLQIWEGREVLAGARIGRVGMTGRTTGPHLHWGLKYNDNWVDPALVLRAMYSEQQTAASNRVQ
ncbi:M23 family metallopeptidase [Oculatella sp. FACHB-28]|uniref:M23 family metallopeptidase n=1 Tax=Oculatella sp. FACHB-28 TaxID=2692845 RepID=UPI00321FD9AD